MTSRNSMSDFGQLTFYHSSLRQNDCAEKFHINPKKKQIYVLALKLSKVIVANGKRPIARVTIQTIVY